MARIQTALDKKRIEAFGSLITYDSDAEHIHSVLMQLYFDYSQLITEDPKNHREGCSGQLYWLSLIILALEGKDSA